MEGLTMLPMWLRLIADYGLSEGEKEAKSSVSIIQTKPTETQEKAVLDIQPSKTHKPNTLEETKKQAKATKIVVNSVIEQNAINSSDDNGPRTPKSQVREAKSVPQPFIIMGDRKVPFILGLLRKHLSRSIINL